MSGKTSQTKGRRGELELVRLLQAHGLPARAGQPVSFGAAPDIVGVDGIHCEVKRVQRLNLCAALRQAAEDAQYFGDGLPAVFHRRNREGWVVSMTLECWLALYKAAFMDETGFDHERAKNPILLQNGHIKKEAQPELGKTTVPAN